MMEFQRSTKELNTYRVLVLCAIAILLEGFDIQAAGVSATKLTLAFQLAAFGKGMFLGASAVGILISSVLGGFLADKYRRGSGRCCGLSRDYCRSIIGRVIARGGSDRRGYFDRVDPYYFGVGNMTLLVIRMSTKPKQIDVLSSAYGAEQAR